jgi:3-oxoacyl-[acyl-carrier protein] reductase
VNLGLEGRVALVGGGSRGLGRAVAEELVGEGASVAICARESESLHTTANELGAVALPADLSVEGEPARVVAACVEHFGRLDILVANAGGPPAGGFESFDATDWRRATALVLASTIELAAAAVPHMRRGGWGRILCVTSITAKRPVDNLLLSNALRPAVAGFAHSLAREVAKDGITVNTILPGYTRTERMVELNVGAATVAEIPLGRLGEPREFAATAAFLVSERASYITGAAVPVDGGWLRGMF